ncbi:MAG: HAMP domain-containing histidine kinase [Clostridiales bacterium]|jgi:signal transduction histidine kinase|nr:HAMP domain-containing histidine kinase [Clostridiales bacterium]
MRFWQRAFFSILALFVSCFYISIFLAASFSYRTSLNSERERAFGEAHFIAASLKKEMSGNIFGAYADYYKKRDICLALWRNESFIYGSLPWPALEKYESVPDKQTATVTSYEGKKYMLVVSAFQSGLDDYTLVYAHDLQSFSSEHKSLSRFLSLSGAAIAILLAAGLYLILRRLSKPIEHLDEATGHISAGDYSRRLPEQGNDELAALARHFNAMTDEIDHKIIELQATAEQKQRFADNLAHELRTPLTAIHGYAWYLKNANINEDDRISSIDYIISETKRIEEMTNKLLDLALMRNNALELKLVNVTELLNSAAEKMRPRLLEKGLRLEMSSQAAELRGDQVLLESLIINLLDNAIKASKKGSELRLAAFLENERTVLEIRDFGKGMPSWHLEKLTEPFYRIDKSRSRSEGGAGLGLSLSSQIAELHKAQLVFSSEEGKGTTVRIVF